MNVQILYLIQGMLLHDLWNFGTFAIVTLIMDVSSNYLQYKIPDGISFGRLNSTFGLCREGFDLKG